MNEEVCGTFPDLGDNSSGWIGLLSISQYLRDVNIQNSPFLSHSIGLLSPQYERQLKLTTTETTQ